jgi:lipoprotein-anchoring transpeptidase ErfK/SrfK
MSGLHRHSFIVFALSLLVIGAAGIKLAGNYWTAKHIPSTPVATKAAARPPISGFNLTVPQDQLQAKLQTITSQPVALTVGTQTIPVKSDTIKSWLQITANKDKTEYYIHVNQAAIAPSLAKLANRYVKSPINQITATEDGTSRVVVGGRNGTSLSDPNTLKIQAQQVAKTAMDSKGLQFNTPLVSVPFQSVTPAAFNKVLIADINTKKMWAFENGNQVNSWLTSDGKPSTPTPVGQFKIYAKFSVQDMKGTNPDGTPYFQPHVRWISYFYQGSAVHGVYWHPRSWFGVNNSSHGCIGLPEDEAQWVYNWAPIGTTVIVHT